MSETKLSKELVVSLLKVMSSPELAKALEIDGKHIDYRAMFEFLTPTLLELLEEKTGMSWTFTTPELPNLVTPMSPTFFPAPNTGWPSSPTVLCETIKSLSFTGMPALPGFSETVQTGQNVMGSGNAS